MAVPFQQFISQAQNRIIPNQFNQQLVTGMFDQLIPVIDLGKQTTRIEWAQGVHTMVAAVRPSFVFPVCPPDEIHVYRQVGFHNVTSGGLVGPVLSIAYPGLTDDFQEIYNVDTSTPINLLASASGSTSRSQRAGLPIRVFPQGILTIGCLNNLAIADVVRVIVLREVLGGPADAKLVNGLIVDSEQ